MSINHRIELIVDDSGLTKTAFAKKLNVSQQYISKLIRTGEPSELFLDTLCREFNISKEWLRTGEGEMREDLPVEDEYFKAATLIAKDNDEMAMNAIIEYWKLDPESKEAFRAFMKNLVQKNRD